MMAENTRIELPVVQRGRARGTTGWLAQEIRDMRVSLGSATTLGDDLVPAAFLETIDGKRSLYLASAESTYSSDAYREYRVREFFEVELTPAAQELLEQLAEEARAEVEKWVAAGDEEAEGVRFELTRIPANV